MKIQGWLLMGLFSVVCFQPVSAKDNRELDYFVKGCSELVQIYKSRNEQRLLAAQTTSLSEAMRAGYCRGVIDSYMQQNRYHCSSTDWFSMASFISTQVGYETKHTNVNNLLELSCK